MLRSQVKRHKIMSKNLTHPSVAPYEGPLKPGTGYFHRGMCWETSFFHSVLYFISTAPSTHPFSATRAPWLSRYNE
jgi:hypothetical protein